LRLDLFLVEKKLAISRTQAQDFIRHGFVFLKTTNNSIVLKKPSFEVTTELAGSISVQSNELQKYVSRAGLKLEYALEHLNRDVEGLSVLDIGQSTGGFTDCLLQKNAGLVVGIDVGQGQLHASLANLPRLHSFENLHVKDLGVREDFLKTVPANQFDLVVMDVSFISITKVMSYLKPFLKNNGSFLFLVKPQFELGPNALDKNGIVKDVKNYAIVEQIIRKEAEIIFGSVLNYFKSSVVGKDGNQEFFIYGKKIH